MKKIRITALILLSLATSAVRADQAATLTCTGTRVVVIVKSPYLGENSSFSQELYILKSKDNNADESKNTAYFLDVMSDIGPGGSLIIRGTNEVKGSFEMTLSPWKDDTNGTVVRRTTSGRVTYSHGPLKGRDEVINCILD